MSDASSSESEDDVVDIVSLITGQAKPSKSNLVAESKVHMDELSPTTNPNDDDDDFNVSLPTVFQIDARKNQTLAERNKKIQKEIIQEQLKVEQEYHELVSVQAKVLQELNDNGTRGVNRVKYSAEDNKELVDHLVRERLRGVDGKKHFYFYSSNNLQSVEESTIPNPIHGNFTNYKFYFHSISKDIKKYFLQLMKIDNYDQLLKIHRLFKHAINDDYYFNWDFDQETFKQCCWLVGCRDDLLSTSTATMVDNCKKLLHFTPNAELIIYKMSILFNCLCMTTPNETFSMAIRVYIFTISDYNLSKLNSDLLLSIFVPMIKNLLLWGIQYLSKDIIQPNEPINHETLCRIHDIMVVSLNKEIRGCNLSNEMQCNFLKTLDFASSELMVSFENHGDLIDNTFVKRITTSLLLSFIYEFDYKMLDIYIKDEISLEVLFSPEMTNKFNFSPSLILIQKFLTSLRFNDVSKYEILRYKLDIFPLVLPLNLTEYNKNSMESLLRSLQKLKDDSHKQLGVVSTSEDKYNEVIIESMFHIYESIDLLLNRVEHDYQLVRDDPFY
ncbi:hypothetical protein CAAN1_06S01552 [[Candida] anglica]|uniref:Uncharacterized protein n=1 Tax=[Candida] anglica TaxID=148631 RepID=A0ABP0ELI5_9ASCO